MEDNFIVDMSQLHLSKEDRVIVKTAEKALRELDFTSFRVWLSLLTVIIHNRLWQTIILQWSKLLIQWRSWKRKVTLLP